MTLRSRPEGLRRAAWRTSLSNSTEQLLRMSRCNYRAWLRKSQSRKLQAASTRLRHNSSPHSRQIKLLACRSSSRQETSTAPWTCRCWARVWQAMAVSDRERDRPWAASVRWTITLWLRVSITTLRTWQDPLCMFPQTPRENSQSCRTITIPSSVIPLAGSSMLS